MKSIAIVISLFVFGNCSPLNILEGIRPEVLSALQISLPIPRYEASDDDVKIYFRHRGNPSSLEPIDLTNASSIADSEFSSEKETFFIIHGWRNEYDSPVGLYVSEAVLEVQDVNVFVVDWSKIADGLYIVAYSAVPDIGKIVAKLIEGLVTEQNLDLNRTYIVGHSLGAHISGLAGAALDGKVNHIVGLDPALPLFQFADEDGRLDATDAQFVQVIHTCSGLLGFNSAIGDADYWPNGGSNQPGCTLDLVGSCSHGRSYLYFAESITSSGFLSHKCDSYKHYKDQKCDSEPTSLMGEYIPDRTANGSYYLKTNDKSPFAKN